MRKLYTLAAAIGVVMLVATGSWALDYTSEDGAVMNIIPGNVDGATTMVFKPSPKVDVDGQSSSVGFAHNAVHSAAIGTSGGQKYGMAADTNKVFFMNVEADTASVSTLATSDSTAFTDWPIMQ